MVTLGISLVIENKVDAGFDSGMQYGLLRKHFAAGWIEQRWAFP
jgi:hypothetical protein